MNYEALKDQWSEIEDRDGVRLSWNTFPSSRMVRAMARRNLELMLITLNLGGFAPSRSVTSCQAESVVVLIIYSPYWSSIYSIEREDRYASASIRTSILQNTMSSGSKSFLVWSLLRMHYQDKAITMYLVK